jgi:type III secretion protein O
MWLALQKLKNFREQQAQTLLLARRAELAAARRAREAAERALQAHRRLADEHERTLYAELMRRQVKLRDIEEVQQAVAQLRRTEQALATHEEEAAGVERQRKDHEAQAHAAHRAAGRVKEKFDQLVNQHVDAEAREAERSEDLELEEAASLRRDSDEWDGSTGSSSEAAR